MDKAAVALALEEIALLLELHGANRFKAGAFRNAARAVERLDADLGALVRAGEVAAVRGIGPATARVVAELVAEGEAAMLRDLRARTPAGMFRLLTVPGLGPSKIAALREQLGIESVEDLERAVAAGTVATVPGFGARTQARLEAGLAFARAGSGQRRRPQALEAAQRVGAVLGALADVTRVEAAGELRRGCETVAGLPIVVAAEAAAHEAIRSAFSALPGGSAEEDSPVPAVRFADGFRVTLELVEPAAFAAALIEATGSTAHVAALRARAGERRIVPARATSEEAFYETLGLAWVPPELREGGNAEIDAAARGALPELVAFEDVRGCLHCHTTYSDGTATIVELATAALERGWRYLGIADHSEAAAYAGGLSPADVRLQHAEVDAWNEANGNELWLFKGVEADILPDGTLDYARHAGVLESFDYVIGSVHSAFRGDRDAMTERVLRALDDPRLTMLGHPTGRLLLTRDAYEIDVERVIERAARRGVAIEINADPRRLELDWRWWPSAVAQGVRTAINPDAHSVAGLDNVAYGITIARKGWLRRDDVLTTQPFEALRDYFAARRANPA